MQSVRKLYNYYAYVVRHSNENFTKVFGVLVLMGAETDFIELRNAVDKRKYFRAETRAYILGGCRGVLYHVVQKSRRNRSGIHTQINENFRHGARMNEIRLAGGALLSLVHFLGIAVCGKEKLFVAFRIIIGNFIKYGFHKPSPNCIIRNWSNPF